MSVREEVFLLGLSTAYIHVVKIILLQMVYISLLGQVCLGTLLGKNMVLAPGVARVLTFDWHGITNLLVI